MKKAFKGNLPIVYGSSVSLPWHRWSVYMLLNLAGLTWAGRYSNQMTLWVRQKYKKRLELY